MFKFLKTAIAAIPRFQTGSRALQGGARIFSPNDGTKSSSPDHKPKSEILNPYKPMSPEEVQEATGIKVYRKQDKNTAKGSLENASATNLSGASKDKDQGLT